MKKIKDYKSTLELVKIYRWDSLIFKFGKNIAFYVFIPFFIICIVIFFFYANEYKKKDMEEFIYVSSYITSDISNVFENIDKNVIFMSSNRIINEYLKIEELENYNHQNYRNYIDTLEILDAFVITSKNIDEVYLFSYESDCLISSKTRGKVYDYSDDAWYNYMKENNDTNFYIEENEKLYIVRDINYNSGFAVFTVKSNSFTENYDDYGIVFENKDKKNTFKTEEGIFEKNGHVYSVKRYGEIKTVISKKFENTYLRKSMILIIIFCIFAAFLFAVIIISVISLISYRNIKDIINTIHKNDFKGQRENGDEISYIIRNIMRVNKENEELGNTLVKKFLEIKKLNSAILQNQISPHFLMNTLNTVNMIILSVMKKKNDATDAVSLLSELFRDILNTNVYTFTIAEEISYCDKYLAIEKILDDSFDVTYDIEDEIKEISIPKLLIQPIIENSIRHGVKYLDDDTRGRIHIEVKKGGNNVIIKVFDNGPLRSDNMIDEINMKLKDDTIKDNEKQKVGLLNTNRRIKLLYGDNYGATLERKENLTVVKITIPLN